MLEEELRGTIEPMRTFKEEPKLSNEAGMSMNEERQSSNAELEIVREQLQSLNEKLTTLNRQLEDKVRELEDANNDLSNLLVCTDIATVFLDRRLHIRRYTPAATRLFSLVRSDLGRAMTDITSSFDDSELLDDARRVLAGTEVEQREVQTKDGRIYLRRLLPYRTDDEPVAGVVMTFTEFTRRKAAELALAESERTLRRITDAMPALISYIDTERRYRFVNAAYQRWFGVAADDVVGRPVVDIVGTDAYAVIGARLNQALAGESVEYEAWLEYEGAGRRYVNAQYIPDRRPSGEIVGVYVLVSDNTERRRSEEAIERLHGEKRSQLAEMQALFDAAPIGIFVARDVECRDMVMNRAGAGMLRLSEEVNPSLSGPGARGLPFRVYHDGRELHAEELPMQVAARRGERIEGFEEELRFDDGEAKTLITYAAPLHDANGEVCGCVGTFADITTLREAEARYRETLERLKLHLDNTPVAALEWDAEMHIQHWSPAAERMFGWHGDEVLGQSFEGLEFVHPEDRAAVEEVIGALLSGEVEQNRSRHRNLRKNGEVIWCDWYTSVLRDDAGGLISVLSLAMDVTDRQQLELDLRLQAERLSEADRRKDEFLSMLGHELRNPLAPLRNALAVLDIARADPQRVDWACRIIDRQTRHLERLVDDLVDTARIARGAVQLKTAPVDLRAVLREALESTEALVQEREHDLELELPEEPVVANGDLTRLVQIVTNLINNAAKYTDPHGSIRLSLVHQDETARITVQDNGRGITREDLPAVFDVFSQGRQSLARADGGLGLGLPLVRKLVELHGGTVQVASDGAGQGSRFTVSLPATPLPADLVERDGQQAVAERDPTTKANAQRIVLVDDNRDVLESLTFFFQILGHEVWDLTAGEPVGALVEQVQPDVVILDIGLPDIDGIEVARRLAALPNRRAMKVIALSGYDEQTADPALFDAHVMKGTSTEALAALLDSR